MRTLLLALCLLLSGCGFTPLYGGGAVAAHFPDVAIAGIPDRDGQALRNLLMDRLYAEGPPAAAPRYTLALTPLQTAVIDLGIQKDATVTRTGLEVTTRMTLADTATGAVVLTRDLHAVGGYDVLDQQYATLVTRQNATEKILAELADDILRALALHFRAQP